MYRQRLAKQQTLVVFLCVVVISTALLCFTWRRRINSLDANSSETTIKTKKEYDLPEKVVVGTVSCRKDDDFTSNNEVVVMIKSILISAKLHQVKNLEFHIFIEHPQDEEFFRTKIQEFETFISNNAITISLLTHSAIDVVPKEFHEHMIYHRKFRCGYTRLFFPLALPDIDSILYLDTDYLVTGNILEFWKHLNKMNERAAVGVVANNQPDALPARYKLTKCFNEGPAVPPIGLNSGLSLMNLTRMRDVKWNERIVRSFKAFTKDAFIDDQSVLNILLYFDPDLLHLLPCQFNIRCTGCDHGFICKEAKEDEYGIQGIHGASNQFNKGGRFHYIYELYKKFDLKTEDILDDLLFPVIKSTEPRSKDGFGKCDPSINQFLYKNILQKK